MDTIGSRLRKIRELRGLSQSKIEEILNIPKKSLSLYELDKRLPSIEVLIQLSNYYNISIDWILGRVGHYIGRDIENEECPKEILPFIEVYKGMNSEEKRKMLYIFNTYVNGSFYKGEGSKENGTYKIEINRKDIINSYIRLSQELGRVANTIDVRRCPFICSPDKITHMFGSWSNFIKETEICKNGESVGMPLKEVIEATLLRKRVECGRRLDYMEFNDSNDLPSASYVRKLYKGMKISEIWDKIECKYNINT